MTWILIPSVASSLESGVSSYSNGVGTYFVINTSGSRCVPSFGGCADLLPVNVTDGLSSIPGVQEVFPIIVNLTTVIGTTYDIINGQNVSLRLNEEETSALIGGPKGFPANLIVLAAGNLPSSRPEFAFNQENKFVLGANQTVDIACQFCMHTAQSHGNVTDAFDATAVGSLTLNPILVNIEILWNSTFMQEKLGPSLYHSEWGGNGSNFVVVKVDNVADLPRVVNSTMSLIQAPKYGLFGVMYNQALDNSLQSLTTQTAPLYQLIGSISLLAVAGITFLVSQLIARRRDWEVGLYLTQGWGWKDTFTLFFLYFLILGLISFAIASLLSTVAIRYFTATYDVYGTVATFTASVDPLFLISAIGFTVLLALFSSYVIIGRLRRIGLDGVLREY
jgi:FtsX-like permease family